MPQKNSVKVYLENGYYHIYNRGVEKRDIFIDSRDYNVFTLYLKEYLLPKDTLSLQNQIVDQNRPSRTRDKANKLLHLRNYSGQIFLIAYCLMPNHYHLLIKQTHASAIDSFVSSLATRYSMYFNLRYKRVGSLCQGVYKAVLVDSDEQLLYLSKYIHTQTKPPHNSSLPYYLGEQKAGWLYPDEILSFFSKTNPRLTYQNFLTQKEDEKSVFILDPLRLEE